MVASQKSSKSRRLRSPWRDRFPRTQRERQEVEATCGAGACFGSYEDGRLLDPVCQYRATKHGPRRITCEKDGCWAALARERLNQNQTRIKKIEKLCQAQMKSSEPPKKKSSKRLRNLSRPSSRRRRKSRPLGRRRSLLDQ